MSRSLPNTSITLMQRVRDGQQDAWSRFAYVYSPLVYSWARRMGLQAADAADVVQDVFHSVSEALDRFEYRGGGSFRAWLATITRNRVAQFHRDNAKHVAGSGGSIGQRKMQGLAQPNSGGSVEAGGALTEFNPPKRSGGDDELEIAGLHRRALDVVKAEFETKTWEIFWRVAVEGDSAVDIAADLGLSKWAVYKAKNRVLRRLRDEFSELLD